MVVEVDDANRGVESVGAQYGDGNGDVVVDAEPHSRLWLGVMKAAADVECHTVLVETGPLSRLDGASDLSALRDQDRVYVDEMRFESEDTAEALRAGGLIEVGLGVRPREISPRDQRGRTYQLGAYQTLSGESPEDHFATRDLDTRDARGLGERLYLVLRVVPQADIVTQPALCPASLSPSSHRAYTEMEPLRKSVLAMCTLITTGLPAAASALASSSVASILEGSSRRSPTAPYPCPTSW